MDDKKREMINSLLKNDTFIKELSNLTEKEEIISKFNKNGVNLEISDFNDLSKLIKIELSKISKIDENNINSGFILKTAFNSLATMAVVGALCKAADIKDADDFIQNKGGGKVIDAAGVVTKKFINGSISAFNNWYNKLQATTRFNNTISTFIDE